jgi:AcrR family transcriptional regulator
MNATMPACPPEPTMPRQRRKEARPAELIEAAIAVFGEKGFAAARLDEIARRAGAAKGTPYLYFAGKEELFKAAIREALVSRIALGERAASEFDGPAEVLLRRLVESWQAFDRSQFGGILKLLVAEAGNFPDLARYYLDEVALRGRRLIAAILQRGIERGEFRPVDVTATAMVIGAPLGFLAIWERSIGRLEETPVAPEDYIAAYLDLVIAGLKAPASPRQEAQE